MRNPYHSEKDFRKIRRRALVAGLVIHSVVISGLFWQQARVAEQARQEELKFSSGGGGGGEGEADDMIQFGPQSNPPDGEPAQHNSMEFTLLDIHVYNDLQNAIPTIQKEEPRPAVQKKKRVKRPQTIVAENLPTRWIRRGTGPGSGGGAGGGSGGGIGKSTGYSIDWGGTGGRRLLSGLIPKYPEGTDKEMAVILQFTVLPDGTVEGILPTRKTDELLENAAIRALHTWRFEPLPSDLGSRTQIGKVSFNFRQEH
ncbi:MAG TPA: TonB family protein [Bacteroidota bacterium]|nr:TonB family protein [Bacteroidota bacterium]